MTVYTAGALSHRPECTNPRENDYVGKRGDMMRGCLTCHAAAPHHLLAQQGGRFTDRSLQNRGTLPAVADVPAPEHVARYLLTCCRCEAAIPCTSPRPRVPLCDRCKTTTHRPKENRR